MVSWSDKTCQVRAKIVIIPSVDKTEFGSAVQVVKRRFNFQDPSFIAVLQLETVDIDRNNFCKTFQKPYPRHWRFLEARTTPG